MGHIDEDILRENLRIGKSLEDAKSSAWVDEDDEKGAKDNFMDDSIAQMITVLRLKQDKKGYYMTTWGKKTRTGLIETIKNILGV